MSNSVNHKLVRFDVNVSCALAAIANIDLPLDGFVLVYVWQNDRIFTRSCNIEEKNKN